MPSWRRAPEASGRRPAATGLAGAVATASLTATLILAVAADGRATRDRPPPAHTGGFGEPTCELCHLPGGGPPQGSLKLDGLPARWEAGRTYPLRIVLKHAGLGAAGFQLSARFENDGAQAGTLAVAPADTGRAGVTVSGDVVYAHHLYEGTWPASADSTGWQLLWTAPQSGGTVTMHIIANAADGDDSPIGDAILRHVARASAASK